jgi:hypothetical protein
MTHYRLILTKDCRKTDSIYSDCAGEDQQLQLITDPSSRQRGRYNITNSNCLQENLKKIEKLVAGPRWAPDTKTDWPTNCRS